MVFNGRIGTLLGDGELEMKTGETMRLFVGNGGLTLPHLSMLSERFLTKYISREVVRLTRMLSPR